MNKEVTFGSITTVPMDVESADGVLSRAVNVCGDTGTLTPVLPPRELFSIGADDRVLVIHTCGSEKHFVVLTAVSAPEGATHFELGYYTYDPEQEQALLHSIGWSVPEGVEVYGAEVLGNTIVMLTSEGMQYFLWREGAYVALGAQPPLPELGFRLVGKCNYVRKDYIEEPEEDWEEPPVIDEEENPLVLSYYPTLLGYIDINLPDSSGPIYGTFSEANREKIKEVFWGVLNKGIAETITEKGLFTFPFFVRYGLRMYDGSVTMISSPILMRTCYGPNIVAKFGNAINTKELSGALYAVAGNLHTTSMGGVDANKMMFERLRAWKDIITSLDIFVSAPIYTYDSNEEIVRFSKDTDNSTTSIMDYRCNWYEKPYPPGEPDVKDSLTEGENLFGRAWNDRFLPWHGTILEMPYYSDTEMEEKLGQECLFYLLKSIPLEELTAYDTLYDMDLTPEEGYLSSLRSRERLQDDYNSRDKLIAKGAFGYNARLNLVDVVREPYAGNELRSAVREISSGEPLELTAYTCIKVDGQPVWLKGLSIQGGTDFNVPYYFHPSTDATTLLITAKPSGATVPDRYVRLPLNESEVLNGSVYVAPFGRVRLEWSEMDAATQAVMASAQTSARIGATNKIYTSEVNNPFTFTRKGVTTVGSGHIYGVSAASRALSQGQFGQFPLYAFTDEGVWALSVSDTGTYTARQPITREVCSEAGAITQLDTCVLFPTARGIMMLAGAECQCISEAIRFPVSEGDVFDVHRVQGMLYDYANRRVLLFRQDCDLCWVYSLTTQGWYLSDTALEYGLNSYPEAIGVCRADGDSRAVVQTVGLDSGYPMQERELSRSIGFEVVTRPLKLDSYGYKTLNSLVCRGTFGRPRFSIVVEGCRTLGQWHRIGGVAASWRLLHMHGSPYRYFRVRVSGELSVGESLMGLGLEFTPKLLRKS